MKKLRYQSETPVRFSIGTEEHYLENGGAYELPTENAYIAVLIAQGILVEIPAEPAPKQTKKLKD